MVYCQRMPSPQADLRPRLLEFLGPFHLTVCRLESPDKEGLEGCKNLLLEEIALAVFFGRAKVLSPFLPQGSKAPGSGFQGHAGLCGISYGVVHRTLVAATDDGGSLRAVTGVDMV